jgi:propanol-preferring alcohol dehydrogenase
LTPDIKSVADVTHRDIGEFLPIAARIPLRPSVQTYRLEEANRALLELKRGPVGGAKVLLIA